MKSIFLHSILILCERNVKLIKVDYILRHNEETSYEFIINKIPHKINCVERKSRADKSAFESIRKSTAALFPSRRAKNNAGI